MKKHSKQQGFTLIEVIIVVAIISFLAVALTTSGLFEALGSSKTKIARIKIASLSTAIQRYKVDNNDYPTTSKGLNSLVPRYIKNTPKDPWGEKYKYISDGVSFDLYSYGADKTSGGSGEKQDIHSE